MADFTFRVGRWLVLMVLLCGGLVGPAAATHIVGGQLRMTHLRADTYTFGLTLYFDDVNGSSGALDNAAMLAIYEKGTHIRLDLVEVRLTNRQLVAYSTPSCAISSLATSQLSYERDFTLNRARYASPRGYYVAWERCCRNRSITNIRTPDDVGQTFYLEFPALLRNGQPFINSTPAAFAPVRDFACILTPFRTAFGGIDPDGDSLIYDLVTPLRGSSDAVDFRPTPPSAAPYARVQWLPGYDSLNQIAGPQPLTVDRRTGEIAFTANQPGLYVFAVRCTEYRAGIRLGEVRREFQEQVLSCPPNEVPTLDLTPPPTGPGPALPYVAGTVVQLPDPPADRCLTLRAVDGENNSQLTFTILEPGALPGTPQPVLSVMGGTVNPNGRRDTLVARLCFDECFGLDGRVHQLALVVADRACPVPQRDTVWLLIQSRLVPDTPPTITFLDSATHLGYVVKWGEQVAFDFRGADTDPDSRVTVSGANLDSARLRAFAIRCQRRTADAMATTSLVWDVDCNVPPGEYDLRLQTQSEACGRSLTADTLVRVTVLPGDTARTLPPNIITPNADGLNDEFQPAAGLKPACNQEFRRFRVFNRWGREIFASSDRLAIWRAENTSGGMYFYFLEYSDRTYKGWVEVVR